MGTRVLRQVKTKAKKLGIEGRIEPSFRSTKRFMLIKEDGSRIHFGSRLGTTFIDDGNKKIRDAWRARHSKIRRKDGKLAHQVKDSPSYLSWHLLW